MSNLADVEYLTTDSDPSLSGREDWFTERVAARELLPLIKSPCQSNIGATDNVSKQVVN